MKLRSLSLAGVGSFADELEVDFEGLTTAGLFLIEGPTGSGKSTILDAIVFALYGSVAGSDSDPGRLNSHLRTESPFVELTFEVARTTYVVKRSPGHQRQKRRGTGMTEVPATAALMRIGSDGPEELATRASDVADHIQRIVGLTKQQFVSTVVLAQGEFATFLDAGTAERAQILERVFGTEFYKRVEDQLHVMRQQARRRRTCATESLNEAVHECGGVLDAQFSDEDPLTEIDAALDQLRSERAQAELTAQRAEERLKRAREALQAGEALVADQNRKREAMRRQADLTQTREQVLAFREQIGAHERATPVGPAIAAWRAAVEDARAAVDVHRRTLQVLLDLGEAPEVDPARLQEVDDLLARLLRPAELERGLSSRRADLERLGSQTRDAGAALLRAQRKREEVDDSVRATSERLQQQPDVAEQISELSAAEARLTARTVLWDELAARRDQWKTADARTQEALELVREAETGLEAAEQAQSRDRAVELASALVAGQPCLVCGSIEHPDPAQPHESRPTGDIARLRQVVQQRRVDADTARGESEKLTGILQHLDSLCAGHDHEQDVADLSACTGEIADLRARRVVREALQEELAGLVSQQLSMREAVSSATLAEQRLAAELAAAQTALTDDEHIVAEACAEHGTVAARRAGLSALRDALKAVGDAQMHAHHCSVA
ncbi:MAG: SMC family ATPase, partial [Candidatus Nanopelagicales bacterium]